MTTDQAAGQTGQANGQASAAAAVPAAAAADPGKAPGECVTVGERAMGAITVVLAIGLLIIGIDLVSGQKFISAVSRFAGIGPDVADE